MNGIRAAIRNCLMDFVKTENSNVICFQEVKAGTDDLPIIDGYRQYSNCATKKGYSGVVTYVKDEPISIRYELGVVRFDDEGRYLELEFPDFTVVNLYMPHGGRQKENLEYKLEVYQALFARLDELRVRNLVLMGDFNIAHQDIDLARPKQNRNNIMFTSEERTQLDRLIEMGFVDSFRLFNPDEGNYTWWPYAFNARERNVGWRIDYGFVSKGIVDKLQNATIYPDAKFSDHCPIGLVVK